MKIRDLDHQDHWETPLGLLGKLDKEFKFDFDPCPIYNDLNKFDGLKCDWGKSNFINPPYSLNLKEAFVKKGIIEYKKNKLCVFLLPVSTSTKLWHDVILPENPEIRWFKGRIPFIGINSKGEAVNWHLSSRPMDTGITHVKNSGQHDSMLVIFRPKNK